MSKLTVGSRVEGGDIVEDYDIGTIREITGTDAIVAWDSQTVAPSDLASLRPVGTAPKGRPTNIRQIIPSVRAKLCDQGYIAVVYAAYGYAGHTKGDIISMHKSRAALESAERRDTTGRLATLGL